LWLAGIDDRVVVERAQQAEVREVGAALAI